MSTPLDCVRDLMEAMRQLGPVLTKLEMPPATYDALKRQQIDRLANALPVPGIDPAAIIGVHVLVVRDLPPGALRLHYSDGRVVTRYRLVRDPSVLQLTFSEEVYGGRRGQAAERHYLTLCVRRWGWVHATDEWGASATHEWAGQRVSPYVPGLARLAELAGLELTDWQRDYVARTVKASFTGHHLHTVYPRHYGRGLPPDTSS